MNIELEFKTRRGVGNPAICMVALPPFWTVDRNFYFSLSGNTTKEGQVMFRTANIFPGLYKKD